MHVSSMYLCTISIIHRKRYIYKREREYIYVCVINIYIYRYRLYFAGLYDTGSTVAAPPQLWLFPRLLHQILFLLDAWQH